jgi:septal ring factor EnvC (AmiA/AmiB activator)
MTRRTQSVPLLISDFRLLISAAATAAVLISDFWFLISAPGTAAAATPAAGSLSERYEAARRSLELQRANEDQARAVRDRLAQETQTLQRRLVENAARVQQLEAAVADTTAQIFRLRKQESDLEADLVKDRARVARLLAVLQRLDADTPPALAIHPDDSLAAARGSMVLGAMLPPVYEAAAALNKRLRQLTATRATLEGKNTEAINQATALATARGELAQLLAQRNAQLGQTEIRLNEIQALTAEISRQASDLKSLMDRISMLRRQGDPDRGMVVVTPRSGGAMPLRRGSLLQPVVGRLLPGDPAGPQESETRPQGLWFISGDFAQVIAPADSEVVFGGLYQKFGQVLLLEIAGGYHLLLAGLDRIDVHIGDRVLAGEPVGILPGGGAARLYLELRRNGQRLDPVPWMSAELRKAR